MLLTFKIQKIGKF